jgi:predicted SAM-dependent methyltransferase
VKLNIGCGNHYASGWVNVDIDETSDVRPDVVADVTDHLPFDDATVRQVYIGHVLEHLALDDVPKALAEIGRVLAPGGRVCVVGPDCDRADQMLARAEIDAVEHELVVTGAGRWAHDVHQWRSTEPVVQELLTAAGFAVATRPLQSLWPMWPLTSAIGWQFALIATNEVTQ